MNFKEPFVFNVDKAYCVECYFIKRLILCNNLVGLWAIYILQSLFPDISLCSGPSPDQSPGPAGSLFVDVQRVDVGSEHVVPEAQAYSGGGGGFVDSWGDNGTFARMSGSRGLHVNVESCPKKKPTFLPTDLNE